MNTKLSFRKKLLIQSIFGFFLFSLVGVAQTESQLPDLGDASREYLSFEKEQEIGKQIMREIRRDNAYIDDFIINDYLNHLGKTLASNSSENTRNYTFFGVKDSMLNAFALPGGYIGVHSALILTTQSESELASVLAHEIGHVTQHHLSRMIANNAKLNVATMVGIALAILASKNSDGQVSQGALAVSQGAMLQSQLGYSREHEREADRMGVDLLQKTGFDVRAMPSFFEKMQKSTRLYEDKAPGYLKTHPLTSERIADMQNRVESISYKQIPDSLEFQLVRNRVKALYPNGDLSKIENLKLFETQFQQKQYNSEVAHRYGLALLYYQNNLLDAFKNQIDWLKKNAPKHAYLTDLYLTASEKLVSKSQTKRDYLYFLQYYNHNPVIVYKSLNYFIRQQDYASINNLLDQWLKKYPTQYEWLYQLKAQIYLETQQPVLGHKFQGEYYYLLDEISEAITQLETSLNIAKKIKYQNFYELSVIESRLKFFKAQDKLIKSKLDKK